MYNAFEQALEFFILFLIKMRNEKHMFECSEFMFFSRLIKNKIRSS